MASRNYTRNAAAQSSTTLIANLFKALSLQDDWKMPKLNPFKKADRSRRSAPWAGANKQKQSMGQRLTKRPKKLLTQTKDMMTPWKSEVKRSPRIRPSRDNRLARRSKHDRWKPFSRWRGDSKKRDFLTTPQDFIAKRQLGF